MAVLINTGATAKIAFWVDVVRRIAISGIDGLNIIGMILGFNSKL